ncbi:MAG: hypothetical protein NC177_05325 [Ruminococcus flavefaciens]|nr:hypothetical protein [Ruminococcus flavefaciens]
MKNEITSKINNVGKVGRIISKIIKGITLACAIVLLVCTLIVCLFIPADDLKFDGTAQGRISYNTESNAFSIGELETEHKDFFGAEFDVVVDEKADPTEKGFNNIDISLSAEKVTAKQAKIVIGVTGFGAVIFIASIYVILMFVVKLCKALEVCQSPFEENVLTAMKKLAYSFIPFGVVSILIGGISILSTALVVLVVLVFVYIFSYGAELQQESDDTV